MLDTVISLLTQYTETPVEEITENSRLIGDLGLTSLDLVDLIVHVEDEYGVMVTERHIETLQTVGDVANTLSELIEAKNN